MVGGNWSVLLLVAAGVGERFVGKKRWASDGPARYGSGEPDLDQRCVGKHVSYRLAELLELVCLSSSLFFPSLPSSFTLPA
jgi:hypothetical protein